MNNLNNYTSEYQNLEDEKEIHLKMLVWIGRRMIKVWKFKKRYSKIMEEQNWKEKEGTNYSDVHQNVADE